MFEFLQEFHRPWHQVAMEAGVELRVSPEYDPTNRLFRDGSLDYDRGKVRIGYNYKLSLPVSGYMWSVLGWIAVKVGRKRRFRGHGIEEPVPYWVWDGHRSHPILVRSEWQDRAEEDETLKKFLCADDGAVDWDVSSARFSNVEAMNQVVRKELLRLSSFWDDEEDDACASSA